MSDFGLKKTKKMRPTVAPWRSFLPHFKKGLKLRKRGKKGTFLQNKGAYKGKKANSFQSSDILYKCPNLGHTHHVSFFIHIGFVHVNLIFFFFISCQSRKKGIFFKFLLKISKIQVFLVKKKVANKGKKGKSAKNSLIAGMAIKKEQGRKKCWLLLVGHIFFA